jgi:hypothetical protein
MSQSQNNGIMNLPNRYSVERTVERLFKLTSLEVLRRKGQIDAVLIEKSSFKEKDSPGDGGVFFWCETLIFLRSLQSTPNLILTGKWAVV